MKPLLLLASLSLFWGLNWPGMKIILSEMTVWWFRATCLIVGGCLLLAVSALSGKRWRFDLAELPKMAGCACFAILGWMVFSAYGVSLMPAGRASIVAFTMPIWATVIAYFLLGESINRGKIAGLFLGVLGLATLIGADLIILKQAPTGTFFMLLAAVSWAIGTVLIKKIDWRIPPLANVAWQLLLSAIPVTLIAFLTEPLPDFGAYSPRVMVALVYIFVFPMAFCQWAYFKTVTLLPASVAAIGTLTIPVIGVYSSHLILGEPVVATDLLALIAVIGALTLVLLIPAWNNRRGLAAPAE